MKSKSEIKRVAVMKKGKMPILPKSVKNAYQLLSYIGAIAMEEPKRISMTMFLAQNLPDIPDMGYPSCGTIGCIAGWTIALLPRWYRSIENAKMILGLSDEQRDDLFYDYELCIDKNAKTKAHAIAVVAHIGRFQKKNEAQLKATKISR